LVHGARMSAGEDRRIIAGTREKRRLRRWSAARPDIMDKTLGFS